MTIEQKIKDCDGQFAAAFNRGDTAALRALHADNAMLLSPDSPLERGSEAVEAGFKELLDAGWSNMSITSIELESSGDLAYHVARFAVDAPTSSGENRRVTGNYVDVYKQYDDGSWKIQVTSFNFHEPLPE